MSDTSLLDGKRVLVVDDEPDILEVLEELLEMCEVVTASTFEKAKELLESQKFDIAILDIMGVDGYGLLDIANKRDIPAVMLTAHAFTADNLVRTIREGAYSYIPKEELSNITIYLIDALKAREKGENPWSAWQNRLPSSYFERRWGSAWKDVDKEFWNQFKESIKTRNSGKK
ncbi:MAG: response regulator [Deltaproteobacteria bacterium]|nr:response regulator [Deltaproteobacteria bacterium]